MPLVQVFMVSLLIGVLKVSESFNFTLAGFDEVLDYIADAIGSDFAKSVNLAQDMIDNPTDYSGPQASLAAIKLAAYRTKIGVVVQYYKQKSTETKKPSDRLTKDALMVIYDALQELINC